MAMATLQLHRQCERRRKRHTNGAPWLLLVRFGHRFTHYGRGGRFHTRFLPKIASSKNNTSYVYEESIHLSFEPRCRFYRCPLAQIAGLSSFGMRIA